MAKISLVKGGTVTNKGSKNEKFTPTPSKGSTKPAPVVTTPVVSNVTTTRTGGTTPTTPSSPSATTPSTPKITSPAGKEFVNNQTATGNNLNDIVAKAQAMLAQTKAEGDKPFAGSSYDTYGSSTPKPSTPTPTTPPTGKPKDTAYIEYLRSMYNPNEAKIAQQNVNDLNKRTSEEIARARKEEDRLRGNADGILEGGQTARLNDLSRISNKSLADLAIAKGYAVDILQQHKDAGLTLQQAQMKAQEEADELLSIADAETLGVPYGTTVGEARMKGIIPNTSKGEEGFTLSEGQARYDAQGNQIASKGKTYAPGTGGTGGGSASGLNISTAARNIIEQINLGGNINDLIKGNSISAQNLRNEVLAGLSEQGGRSTPAVELLTEGKSVVDAMLSNQSYKALGGYSSIFGGQYSTAYGDAMARAQQLQAILARDNLGLLKGAMSDKDLAFIQSMSSGFEGAGTQSEAFIKSRLEDIQRKLTNKLLSGAQSQSQPPTMNLNGRLLYLQPDGTYE